MYLHGNAESQSLNTYSNGCGHRSRQSPRTCLMRAPVCTQAIQYPQFFRCTSLGSALTTCAHAHTAHLHSRRSSAVLPRKKMQGTFGRRDVIALTFSTRPCKYDNSSSAAVAAATQVWRVFKDGEVQSYSSPGSDPRACTYILATKFNTHETASRHSCWGSPGKKRRGSGPDACSPCSACR